VFDSKLLRKEMVKVAGSLPYAALTLAFSIMVGGTAIMTHAILINATLPAVSPLHSY
jgi:hypothetical protein